MNHSKQREVVKNVVIAKRWHPTASEVFVEAKKLLPKISLGTVYRDLQQLVESKEIIKLTDAGGEARFDGAKTDHIHFLCVNCGQLFDIESETATKLIKSCYKCCEHQVDSACILLKGVCAKCEKNK